ELVAADDEPLLVEEFGQDELRAQPGDLGRVVRSGRPRNGPCPRARYVRAVRHRGPPSSIVREACAAAPARQRNRVRRPRSTSSGSPVLFPKAMPDTASRTVSTNRRALSSSVRRRPYPAK